MKSLPKINVPSGLKFKFVRHPDLVVFESSFPQRRNTILIRFELDDLRNCTSKVLVNSSNADPSKKFGIVHEMLADSGHYYITDPNPNFVELVGEVEKSSRNATQAESRANSKIMIEILGSSKLLPHVLGNSRADFDPEPHWKNILSILDAFHKEK